MPGVRPEEVHNGYSEVIRQEEHKAIKALVVQQLFT